MQVSQGLLPPSSSLHSKGPDRKTVERLVARLVQSGKAKRITTTIPGSYTNGQARMVRLMGMCMIMHDGLGR